MGWFGRSDEEDKSLIEISNDNGDHWVAEIPTKEVKATERALKNAGCDRDYDEWVAASYHAKKVYDERDHDQYRYQSARVVDEKEDLEDSYDQENDTSDYERDEQPAWRWW